MPGRRSVRKYGTVQRRMKVENVEKKNILRQNVMVKKENDRIKNKRKIGKGTIKQEGPRQMSGNGYGHGYLSVVSVVCCQVEVSATS
jgi:hypothetical protein